MTRISGGDILDQLLAFCPSAPLVKVQRTSCPQPKADMIYAAAALEVFRSEGGKRKFAAHANAKVRFPQSRHSKSQMRLCACPQGTDGVRWFLDFEWRQRVSPMYETSYLWMSDIEPSKHF